MAAIDFYNLPTDEKREIFSAVGNAVGLPVFIIEKDWWVVQTLRIIFQLEVGQNLLFKGGTSLSKAWGIIDRFSEDIDLVLNREFLGFEPGLISKTQVRKLRTSSFNYLTETFKPILEKAFKDNDIADVDIVFENLGEGDQDPISLLISYPKAIEYVDYIEPRIKVEVGSRSLVEPYSNCTITSLIDNEFPQRPFSSSPIEIPCVNPERTFLEKLFLLHEEFQKPEGKIRVSRLSRHLYDIYRIAESNYKNQAFDKALIDSIIMHRERFNNIKEVDYSTLYPPTLQSDRKSVV